jgi:NAD(P)-dependent dehydrogenase (short-subunit alcohol dehydrogenase family)
MHFAEAIEGGSIMATALITGTSSGIGLATAVTLARSGHAVIATMRKLDPSGELSSLVEAERLPVTMLTLDVNDDASVNQAFAKALAEHGHIDVLVNNAGIGQPGSVEETPLDVFRRIMETNYFGALRCIKAVLPGMLARRTGCIINISSVVGRIALSPQAPYAASKHALEALSECLAQEVRAFNIRVALVEPGPIATPIVGKISPGLPKSAFPQGRRLAALFAALMKQPTSAYVVGDQIRQIIESGSWRLRYQVGHTRILQWRAKTNDEEWISVFSGGDNEFAAAVKRELGVDLAL